MSITLAIDTSGDPGEVALLDGMRALSYVRFDRNRRYEAVLGPAIREALAASPTGASGVAEILVATGPGSYTGLRIGIAAARALAFALGVRAIGIPSFDAIASAMEQGPAGFLVVAADARRGNLFTGSYEREGGRWARVGGFDVETPAALAARTGPGALLAGPLLRTGAGELEKLGFRPAGPEHAGPCAVGLAGAFAAGLGEEEPLPIYLGTTPPVRFGV